MAKALFREAVALQVSGQYAAAAKRYCQLDIARLLRRGGGDGSAGGPDFLIVGAPRSGTTWLKSQLAKHPNIRILPGEVHYFSMTPRKDPFEYVNLFRSGEFKNKSAGVVASGPVLFGEKSPSYFAMSSQKIFLLTSLFPNVRVVCMVREPIERAWSHIRHFRLDGRQIPPGFKTICAHGHYAECIYRWIGEMPKEQIHIVGFDEICKDPVSAYTSVLSHIGATQIDVDFPPIPQSTHVEMPDLLRLALEAEYAGEPYDLAQLRRLLDRPPSYRTRCAARDGDGC